MTLWLTVLLVWTTGIPAAVFFTATLGAHIQERRLTRLGGLLASRGMAHAPAHACHRRVHRYGLAQSSRRFAARRR